MSYTMTFDMPETETAFVERQGPRFRSELNTLFVAIIQAKMQCENDDKKDAVPQSTLDFAADWGRFRIQDDELDLSRTDESLHEVDFG